MTTRTVYQIRDMLGETVAEHVRIDLPWGKKLVSWRVPGCDPRDGLMGMPTVDLPLYGTERVPSFTIGQTVVVGEGEKATEALWACGIDALGTVTGAASTPGEDALSVLLPFDVVLWPDHDREGYRHLNRGAWEIHRLGGTLPRYIGPTTTLADGTLVHFVAPKGFDAADVLERNGGDRGKAREIMLKLIDHARPWDLHADTPKPRLLRPMYDRAADDDRVQAARSHLLRVVEDRLGPPKEVRQGTPWWCCPFHNDRSPSFKVDTREPFYRCLSGHTKVMTWDGLAPIRDLSGGTHKLLTTGGIWVDAPIQSYGEDKVSRVHLTRNGVRKVVNATADHRWLIRTNRAGVYREATTATLKTGSPLAYAYPPLGMLMKAGPAPFGIAQGFVFGDGTQMESGGASVTFHGEKREMLRYFPESRLWGDDELPAVGRLPRFFRCLPPLSESPGYLYGWLAGYFAADGCVSKDGQVILSSAVRDNLEYVATLASHLGIGVYGLKKQWRLGRGQEPSWLYHLTFVNSTLTGDFFVREKHRGRFEAVMSGGRIERKGWVCDGIETTTLREEVFCATVDRTHAFALDGNLLTGNCFGCPARGDVFTFLRELDGVEFKDALSELAPQKLLGAVM